MACPGSIRLSAGIPDEDSAASLLGTAAHALAEICLRDERAPDDYLGRKVIDADPASVVDEDMAAAVGQYLKVTRKAVGRADFHAIEQKLTLAPLGGAVTKAVTKTMFGTGDFIAYRRANKTLLVIDYKHGAGVVVEARNNPQLRYYGLAALVNLSQLVGGSAPVERVRMAIVQPRAPHADGPVRSDEIDAKSLLDWGRAQLVPAAEATRKPDAPLHPGSHCRFCPAAAICPALRASHMQAAKMAFSGAETGGAEPDTTVELLNNTDLRQILDAAKNIRAWLAAVEKHARDTIADGGAVPGYKLVAARATRKWVDEAKAADRLCEQFGLGDEDIFETPKMRSPAQVEKAIGKKKEVRALLETLVSAESTGTSLAPESDKRPSVEAPATQAGKAFADVTTG